jgi:hypothetical protein
MKAAHSQKIQQAITLLESVQTDLQELLDMKDAEELHGQEVDPDLGNQVECVDVALNQLSMLYPLWALPPRITTKPY